MLTVDELAKMIDHSIIDPFSTEDDLVKGIEVARQYCVGQFVTQPFRVSQAKGLLEGSGIALQTPIGYPYGTDLTEVKLLQAKRALDAGVDELDMVINLSALFSDDIAYVEDEIRQVVELAKPYGVVVKSIIEVFFLDEQRIRQVVGAAEAAGVGFIKTSTGTRPDKVEDVERAIRLIRSITRPETIIKASGGVYTLDAVLSYYDAGARRFGASETARILDDFAARLDQNLLVAGAGA